MDPVHNKTISVGDLVKEHTKHSKHRKGLITHKRGNYWLTVKWLNGDEDDKIVAIYDVTKVCNKCMQQK